MLDFWEWLKFNENDFRTGCKLGLYPDIADALGQQPPLYGMSKSADLITYLYLVYGEKGPPCSPDGYYWPHNVQIPSLDGFTPRYANPGPHRHQKGK
jgi:hypothetical protein